jgi:hypothetical protein
MAEAQRQSSTRRMRTKVHGPQLLDALAAAEFLLQRLEALLQKLIERNAE